MPPAQTVQSVATAVERASQAWTLIKATAALWMPRLSPERQAQVTHALAIGDQAIATARVAATVAEATAALAEVNDAAGTVTTLAR
ncbi:MAG TPA: hypothetical protein VIO38_17300 [Rariglobus sp.]